MEKRHLARKVRKIAALQDKLDLLMDKADSAIGDVRALTGEVGFDCSIFGPDDLTERHQDAAWEAEEALYAISDQQAELNEEVAALLHDVCEELGVNPERKNG